MHTRRRSCTTVPIVVAFALAFSAGIASAQENKAPGVRDAEAMTQGWPKASRDAIAFMRSKYGAPASVGPDMVVWGKTGPWKRTIVFRTEVPHNFPMPHTDVMQQWTDYKAPTAMYDELAEYDGSVVLERTSGEISARCDKEAANFLALNLADDIVRGRMSVDAARAKYGEQIMAMKAGKPAPYTEKLRFAVQRATEDPDQKLPMK